MAKSERPSIDLGALGEKAGKTHNPVTVLEHRKKGTSKGRDGRVQIQGFFDPSYRKTIKMLATRDDTTIEALLLEAMEDLFKKRNMEMV